MQKLQEENGVPSLVPLAFQHVSFRDLKENAPARSKNRTGTMSLKILNTASFDG